MYTANDSQNGNWTYGYDTVNRLQTAGWRRASAALRLGAGQVRRSMVKTEESFK